MPKIKPNPGFSAEEREAMKARARELASEAKQTKKKEEGEKDVQAAIAALAEPDRSMAARVHELVKAAAPELWPKTWYGMPAYAHKEGDVVCFFKSGDKYKSRYATFGFNDPAKLDEGNMWATSYALTKLTAIEEQLIVELVKKSIA